MSSILKTIPIQLHWCDEHSMERILSEMHFDADDVQRAVRSLIRKKFIQRVIVNLPDQKSINKQFESHDGEIRKVTAGESTTVSMSHWVMKPTVMIGPIKLWAGISGVNFRVPDSQAEWIARMRLSVALAQHLVQRDHGGMDWQSHESRFRSSPVFFLVSSSKTIVVPVRYDQLTIERVLQQLIGQRGNYEVW